MLNRLNVAKDVTRPQLVHSAITVGAVNALGITLIWQIEPVTIAFVAFVLAAVTQYHALKAFEVI